MDITALAVDVDHLVRPGGLLDQLEALVPEQATNPENSGGHHKVTGSPAPWHQAGFLLLEIHEGARRLEASLRRDTSGRLGDRRGGSTTNTRDALKSCVRLAEALDDDQVQAAARIVGRWVRAARQLKDIDQADRWEPLPRQPGMLPPACHYCGTYSLRWNRRSGEVRCILPDCRDEDGHRPVARMEIGRYSGQAALVWRDGRTVTYAHREPAA
ncbi:hypothetical protein [Thermomonospora cellulosilytica]|uniref:Uncharacterized protein n=1 Tax=Thermomonospora cellulosilytica TaxID=1411118 RepID=A0A7W3R6Y4_9ACTN|nr:hypothetical protein [Thermomonospora cellulosilytica]MBA9002026.1 hypothetical protein [Thermomonospora cellulosilytica]